jgi:hypothetical protein
LTNNNNNTTTKSDRDIIEERVKALDFLYARARQRIREKGGMLTTQQAIEEIMKEAKQEYKEALEDVIESDPEAFAEL